MLNETPTISRRRLFKLGILGLAAIPACGFLQLIPESASAADLPRIDENDPAAQALGYKHDATQVDVEKFPKRKAPEAANQFCSNCQLYTGAAGAEWGPCSIFSGKAVNAKGWCNAWIAKQG